MNSKPDGIRVHIGDRVPTDNEFGTKEGDPNEIIALDGEPLTLEDRGRERVQKVVEAGRSMFSGLRERIGSAAGNLRDRLSRTFFTAVGGAEAGVEAAAAGAAYAKDTVVAGGVAAKEGVKSAVNAADSGARSFGNAAVEKAYEGAALGFMAGEAAVDKAASLRDTAAEKIRAGVGYAVGAADAVGREMDATITDTVAALESGRQKLKNAAEITALAGALGLAIGSEGLSMTREFAGRKVAEGKEWAAEKGAAIVGTLERKSLELAVSAMSRWEAFKSRVNSAREAFATFRNENRLVRAREIGASQDRVLELERQVAELRALMATKAEVTEVSGI